MSKTQVVLYYHDQNLSETESDLPPDSNGKVKYKMGNQMEQEPTPSLMVQHMLGHTKMD